MSLRIAAVLSLLVTVIGAAIVLQGSTYRYFGDQQGYQPAQPIVFSHRLHAGDNQIPCLYCHSAADKSSVASIPSATTCMNCHSQIKKDSPEVQKIYKALAQKQPIQWVRIYDLPDHVRFDHSRHVVAGIRCQQCHGPVETMDRLYQFNAFTMGTCVECHRTHREVMLDDQGKPRIARENTPAKLMASTDCSVCHH